MAPNNDFALFYDRSFAPIGEASRRTWRRKPAQNGHDPIRAAPETGPAATRFENELQDGSIGRILYTRFPWRTIIPLREPLLARCSHLPAYSDGAALRDPKAARMPI